MKTRTKWFLGVLFGTAVIGSAVNSAINPRSEPSQQKPLDAAQTKELMQHLLAQQCVAVTLKNLHDPLSAQVPDASSDKDYPSKFYIGERKKGVITIQFEIRARNGFNALRANMVNCDFKDTGKEYKFVKYDSWQK